MNNKPRKPPIFVEKPRKKKALGQHFLRKQSVVDHMIERVAVTSESSVMEIGCGDGFLTRSILEQTTCKRLWVYEIDSEWAAYVRELLPDERLTIRLQNILDLDFDTLKPYAPWVLLANLPYQITFPIFYLLAEHKALFSEGVVMIQEEVAQKIVAKRGKTYSPTTIFLQYHFELELMEKIEPGAFAPPPKVNSRLIYFKPKLDVQEIPDAQEFWKFLKLCFTSPRQTLRNNLRMAHYDMSAFDAQLLGKRAQELSFEDFLAVWEKIR